MPSFRLKWFEKKHINVALLRFGNSYEAINRLVAGSNTHDFWYLLHNHVHQYDLKFAFHLGCICT